mmetsp:Transcript_24600/g.59303  ORF Transcript_24600/g.59303 Transcript_24600/m.59303 type:complete len:479 (+) Transcript_24600:218-1654(+)
METKVEMNANGEEPPSSIRVKDHAHNASRGPTGRRVRPAILGWLVLSIAFTLASVAINHRHFNSLGRRERYRDEHNHLPPPQTRRRKKGKTRIDAEGRRRQHRQTNETAQSVDYGKNNITAILRGETPFPEDTTVILKYRPGDLEMSSAEALRYCHVNTTRYKNHLKSGPRTLVSASHRHKLYYRNIPKSSSSSARHAMETYFEGEDTRIKIDDLVRKVNGNNRGGDKHELISFVREPLNRFYSSYDEAHYRWGPWMGSEGNAKARPMVAKAYHEHKHAVLDRYPYIYDGMSNLREYMRLFCPREILDDRGRKASVECNTVPSIDDGTLTRLFERFVRDYDGHDPFDVHLSLQVPHLVDGRDGRPLPISRLYNASEAERGWQDIAEARGVTIPEDGLRMGRKITRRFNVDMVSDATKQKICRLMALDYCCLNIELPSVCRTDEGDGVYCAMEKKFEPETNNARRRGKSRLFIQPLENK